MARNIVFILLCIWMSNSSFAQNLESNYLPIALQKVFVHTDRDLYTVGGDIFYKAYVTNAEGLFADTSNYNLYIDLINTDGIVIESALDNLIDGTASNAIPIGKATTTGTYILRAYTDHIKDDPSQHFYKKIFINGLQKESQALENNDTIYMSLLPEGGEAINGIHGYLGIHAHDIAGNPIIFEGSVDLGSNTIPFETNNNGMASVGLVWQSNGMYNLSTEQNRPIKYDLPKVKSQGASIHAKSTLEYFEIDINSLGLDQPLQLLMHLNGNLIRKWEISNGSKKLIVDKSELPPGVLHLSLLDINLNPISERLVFNKYGANDYNIDLTFDQPTYSKISLANLLIDAYDDDGESIEGRFSVSITDKNVVEPIASNANIRSYYYLSTALSGYIHEPNQYLSLDNESEEHLDLLMQIYGWRKFKELPLTRSGNVGINLTGRITKKNQPEKGLKSNGFITVLGSTLNLLPFETDEHGDFNISNLVFEGNRDLIIQAAADNGKSKNEKGDAIKLNGNRNVDIILTEAVHLPFSDLSSNIRTETTAIISTKSELLRSYENYNELLTSNDVDDDIQMSIDLDEVSISEESLNPVIEEYKYSMTYASPDSRIMASDLPLIHQYRDIYDILRGRAGIIFDGPDLGSPIKHKVILRGYTAGNVLTDDAANFYVNGNYVNQYFAEMIRPEDIAFVDIVKTFHQLTTYGESGTNGIIFIYLKPPGLRRKRVPETYNGILSTSIEGYTKRREFYKPNYGKSLQKDDAQSDERVTIHWEPNILIGNEGSAALSFYTANRSTTYQLILQGISSKGIPIYAESTIDVK